MRINKNDVEFETSRSGGPGGQHVNRRATAARLRAKIGELPLSDEEKELLRENLPPRFLVKGDEFIIENSDSRSQQQNKKNALKQANEAIEKALEEGRQRKKRQKRKKRISAAKKGGSGGGNKDIHEEQKQRRRSESTDDLLEAAYEEAPEIIGPLLEEE
ncbi:MAG: peptide chain release factor-like protein [bacterium]